MARAEPDLGTTPDQPQPCWPRGTTPLAELRQLLISRGVPPDADDDALLTAARAARHKLDVTLLSARESAGCPLPPGQRAELAAHRDRLARYRAAWEVISGVAPHAQVVKGWAIGDHYPAGLLRAAGDLDVVCPPGELWQAAVALRDRGWELGAFTLFPAKAGSGSAQTLTDWCHVLVELNRPSDSGYIDEPYGVELRTADVATSIQMPAMRLNGTPSPAAASILALVAERWERPFRSRDIYDLAVLTGRLDDAGRKALSDGLTATTLWPQLRELSRLLRRSGLAPGLDQPGGRRAAGRGRVAQLGRSMALWSHPLRAAGLLAISTVDADRGAFADRLAQIFQRKIGAWRLLRLGLPLFAVPLPGPPQADTPGQTEALAQTGAITLVRRGGHLIAATPLGSFLLVAGSCPQDWLEQARAG